MALFPVNTISFTWTFPDPITKTCGPPPLQQCQTMMSQSPVDWMDCHRCSASPREKWSLCRHTEPLSDCQDTRKKVGNQPSQYQDAMQDKTTVSTMSSETTGRSGAVCVPPFYPVQFVRINFDWCMTGLFQRNRKMLYIFTSLKPLQQVICDWNNGPWLLCQLRHHLLIFTTEGRCLQSKFTTKRPNPENQFTATSFNLRLSKRSLECI